MGAGALEFRAGDNRRTNAGVASGGLLRARADRRLDARRRTAGQRWRLPGQPVHAAALRAASCSRPTTRIRRVGFARASTAHFAAHDVAWLEGTHQSTAVDRAVAAGCRSCASAMSRRSSQGWDEAMIPDSIIRGTSGWQPRPAGEGVDPEQVRAALRRSAKRHLGFEDLDRLADDPHAVELAVA